MGTSRDGRVSKKVAGAKLRYADKNQAQRIELLINYINFTANTGSKGMTFADIARQLNADFQFSLQQLEKIKKQLKKDGIIDDDNNVDEKAVAEKSIEDTK